MRKPHWRTSRQCHPLRTENCQYLSRVRSRPTPCLTLPGIFFPLSENRSPPPAGIQFHSRRGSCSPPANGCPIIAFAPSTHVSRPVIGPKSPRKVQSHDCRHLIFDLGP